MSALLVTLVAVLPLAAAAFALLFVFGHTQGPAGPYSQSDLKN